MANIEQLKNLIEQSKQLQEQINIVKKQIRDAAGALDLGALKLMDYDDLKCLYNDIIIYINDKQKADDMFKLLHKKKAEKYPQLNKPVYYPEIDSLDISAEDKLRLDKAVRDNIRYFINTKSLKKFNFNSVEELELLRGLGILERKYMFNCSVCDEHYGIFSETELNKYKRVFELRNIENLTDEQKDELEELYEEGYFEILFCCNGCDEEIKISNMHELESFKDFEIYYCVCKNPDLTYELL